MTTRTRSVLIDTTIGKIFNNVVSVSSADASKLIAGSKPLTVSTSQSGTAKVALNVGNGLRFAGPALLTTIQATTTSTPTNQNIILTFKTGTDYDVSSTVATVNLVPGLKNYYYNLGQSNTVSQSISISAGNYLFWDITQVGIGQPGQKIAITYTYYSGY